jgi:hypothetical protein
VNGAICELIARCRAAGLSLLTEAGALHVEFERDPPINLIEEIRRYKPQVMAALSAVTGAVEDGPASWGAVIAPACWVAGAGGVFEPSFELPCHERRGLVERRGAVFLHFCVECGRWGAYGYGVTANHPGRWFCFSHRPVAR